MTQPQHKYVVIFTSKLNDTISGYSKMSDQMERLAQQQPGFLGMESVRENIGITVSYWESLEAIQKWKENSAHLYAQEKGKNDWYNYYKVQICKIEREYEFSNETVL